MNRMKWIVLCASENFRKWRTTPRIGIIAAIILIFGIYDYTPLSAYGREVYGGISSWILPFMFPTALMIVFFNCITTAFFSNAPFADRHMPFLVIRTGRLNWILGQILYIILAAAVYVGYYFLVSIVCLLPSVNFSNDWGAAVSAMAAGQYPPSEYHITIFFSDFIVDHFTPVEATAISVFLMWGVSVFLGCLIMVFNVISSGTAGIIAAGVLSFLPYLWNYFGNGYLGGMALWVTPTCWCTMYGVDFWNASATPPFPYVAVVLIGMSALMAGISAVVFCRKNLNVPKEEF